MTRRWLIRAVFVGNTELHARESRMATSFWRFAFGTIVLAASGFVAVWADQPSSPASAPSTSPTSAPSTSPTSAPTGQADEKATLEEIRAMSQWALKAGKEGQADVTRRAAQKTDLTPRQRVLWMTTELKRYVEEHQNQ